MLHTKHTPPLPVRHAWIGRAYRTGRWGKNRPSPPTCPVRYARYMVWRALQGGLCVISLLPVRYTRHIRLPLCISGRSYRGGTSRTQFQFRHTPSCSTRSAGGPQITHDRRRPHASVVRSILQAVYAMRTLIGRRVRAVGARCVLTATEVRSSPPIHVKM